MIAQVEMAQRLRGLVVTAEVQVRFPLAYSAPRALSDAIPGLAAIVRYNPVSVWQVELSETVSHSTHPRTRVHRNYRRRQPTCQDMTRPINSI